MRRLRSPSPNFLEFWLLQGWLLPYLMLLECGLHISSDYFEGCVCLPLRVLLPHVPMFGFRLFQHFSSLEIELHRAKTSLIVLNT